DARQKVTVCVGADLTASKTAVPAFTRTYLWNIAKAVDRTHVDQVGGTVTFNYTVTVRQTGFTDSGWAVTGTITVTNPNDFEDVTVDISDAVDNGGNCTVTNGTGVVVPKSRTASRGYSCSWLSAPG